MLTQLFHGLCDLVYPHICILCKKELHTADRAACLCSSCQISIELNVPPFCQKCSRHLKDSARTFVCAQCLKTALSFDEAWGVCLYNDPLRRLIHLFKYGGKLALAHEFSQIILRFVDIYHIDLSAYDLVIPVPLHPARLRERGYNQSELLSDAVAGHFLLPCEKHTLIRTRHTHFQARLSPKQRWTNLDGAFRINHPDVLKDRSVLVVDDLMTTGATASEIARLLKHSGACRVGVLTLAMADLD